MLDAAGTAGRPERWHFYLHDSSDASQLDAVASLLRSRELFSQLSGLAPPCLQQRSALQGCHSHDAASMAYWVSRPAQAAARNLTQARRCPPC